MAFMREIQVSSQTSIASPGATVVIVDDDASFVNALARMVSERRPDARVLTALDGFAGGMLVAAERPDLLLLDVHMNGMDGVEVCRRIRANVELASVQIVILSGHLTPESESELRRLGVLNCFHKPVPPQRIHALLHEHLPPRLMAGEETPSGS